MQAGIDCLYGVLDYLRTGEASRESDIGLGFIWKYMATTVARNEGGGI